MPDSTCSWPGDEWERADPDGLGIRALALSAAAQALARPQSNARAWLVVQGGRIIAEQYFHGSNSATRQPLFSITKSVLGLLVGLTLADHLDQPVLDFFPKFTLPLSNAFHLLTVRHLLTMTSGLVWPGAGWGSEPMRERMLRSPDWTEFILNVPVRRSEIGVFHYNSAASHLLALILWRATGLTPCEIARARLFSPLGINQVVCGVDWEVDPAGCSIGGWGLHLSAPELARIGWLALCGGTWQGQTVVSSQWLEASTRLAEGESTGYGYHWWLRRISGEPVFAGIGIGGQYLFCVPGRQTVAVILSQRTHRWPDRWEVLKLLLA